jgi:hypothetical protein
MVDGYEFLGARMRTLALWQWVALVILVVAALTLVSFGLRDSQAAIPVQPATCGSQGQSVWVILREESEAVDTYDANVLNVAECMRAVEADLARSTPVPIYEHGLGEPIALH